MQHNFLLLILLLPLIGFIINGLFRNSLPKIGIAFISNLVIFLSFLISLYLFNDLLGDAHKEITKNYFFFINIEGVIKIPFELTLDRLSSIYLLIITGVGFLIHLFSVGYMWQDKGFGKYFAYLNLFIFSMLLLVLGSNLVILFFGWEGVGVCSYLLIGFWYEKSENNLAARKAFIMNRIGDLGLLIALFWIYQIFGRFDFSGISSSLQTISVSTFDVTFITLFLFIGAVGKSAQIPLYTWLPDAMAGPTPVSALIHAATMVTAGIYLLARCHFLFELAPITKSIVAIIGLSTALFSATIALRQNDIKKVLAYSTVSQLGFMFLALGMGNYAIAVFHVMTHAFFKALLFLCSGSIIHAMGGEQDIRKMGGLSQKLKWTHFAFLIGALAISGIPGLSGFFSKDLILSSTFEHNSIFYIIGLLTAFLTALYIFRLYFLVFHGKFRGGEKAKSHLHESPFVMVFPLIVLAFFSIIGGYFSFPKIFGGNEWLLHYLNIRPSHLSNTPIAHSVEILLMVISTLGVIVLIFLSKKYFSLSKMEDKKKSTLQNLVENKYFVDEFYNSLFVKPILFLGGLFSTLFEVKIIDRLVDGIGNSVLKLSRRFRHIQTGYVNDYILWFVFGTLLFFIVQLFY